MLRLNVATFLRSEWEERYSYESNYERTRLVVQLLKSLYGTAKPCQLSKLWPDGPPVDFLAWLFEGIDDLNDWDIRRMHLLEFACDARLKTVCHYLVTRGCSMTLRGRYVMLEKSDLLDFIDLCCGFEKGSYFGDLTLHPAVELFLVRRGIDLCLGVARRHPVMEVLEEGFTNATFSNRNELIKLYLARNSELPTDVTYLETADFVCSDSAWVYGTFGNAMHRSMHRQESCRIC